MVDTAFEPHNVWFFQNHTGRCRNDGSGFCWLLYDKGDDERRYQGLEHGCTRIREANGDDVFTNFRRGEFELVAFRCSVHPKDSIGRNEIEDGDFCSGMLRLSA